MSAITDRGYRSLNSALAVQLETVSSEISLAGAILAQLGLPEDR